MRALSIIGIIMSIGGLLTCLFIMTEAKSNCYCDSDYLYSSGSVPGEAIGGSLIMMIICMFFLVFSIVAASRNFGKDRPILSQPIPPFQANLNANYNQPYNPQFPPNPFQQQNPYVNPYQQNPNQFPPQNPNPPQPPPPVNPWAPPQ